MAIDKTKDIKVGGTLHSIATGNIIAHADEIMDENWGKNQSAINLEIRENITNIADEEDITLTEEKKLQLKDRDSSKGMGYKILRLPEDRILTQEMINEPNTIYEIRYDFDLNGLEITIPKDCTLKFEGGSLNNGIVNSVELSIENAGLRNITLKGTLRSGCILFEWWDYDILKSVSQLFLNAIDSAENTGLVLKVPEGTFLFTPSNNSPRYCVYASTNLSIQGSGRGTIFKTVKTNLEAPDGSSDDSYGTWLYCLAKTDNVAINFSDFTIDGGNRAFHSRNTNVSHKAINLQLENYSGHWIKTFHAFNILVQNFEGEAFYNSGYVSVGRTDYLISNCSFINNGGSSGNIGGSATYRNCDFYNANIEHCISANNIDSGTLIVDGCSFKNRASMLSCDKLNMSSGWDSNSKCHCIITNCHFENGEFEAGSAIILKELENVIISNNTFVNAARDVTQGHACIRVIKYVTNINIKGNTFISEYPYSCACIFSEDSYKNLETFGNISYGTYFTYNPICDKYIYLERNPNAGTTLVLRNNNLCFKCLLKVSNSSSEDISFSALNFCNKHLGKTTIPKFGEFTLELLVNSLDIEYYIPSTDNISVEVIIEKALDGESWKIIR